ncbi:MAG: hypothetical protein FJZ01_13135 [Candidatus Sericytochromatia bacterium]|nr:hypothetical protein [Candidatus Tanganyikabacteria bacterium]
MKKWVDLYQRHAAMREGGATLPADIRARLVRLSEMGHCDASIQGRFSSRTVGRLREWHVRPRFGTAGPERLKGVAHLESAHLSIQVLSDSRTSRIHQFTAEVQGQASGGQGWLVAVHLDDDRDPDVQDRGLGACSHPSFHCHVGTSLEAVPKVRVPLPDVGPVGALDWLLSLVIPDWEPAPWPAVRKALDVEQGTQG